jgi:adenine phosphoribosyltransferase
MASNGHWLTEYVRDIADYPTTGVSFRDITPLLGDAHGFGRAVTELAHRFDDVPADRVLGMEARGFIIAAPVVREEYSLEYGNDKLEIHRDAIHPGERVLVIDDVLATGGTAAATVRLVETLGGVVVGVGFLIELDDLGGRARLDGHLVESLARY